MKKSKFRDFLLTQHFLKITVFLFVSILLLQTFYVIKLSEPAPLLQLFQTRNHVLSRKTTIVVKHFVNKLRGMDVIDQTGLYFIVPNIITPVNGIESHNETEVTICVHCTANHLHLLPDLLKQWEGPISVAIFMHGPQTIPAVQSVINLYLCHENVRKFVSFHLVIPIRHAFTNFDELFNIAVICSEPNKGGFEEGVNYDNQFVQYPSNTLRNVAIQFTSTPYILIMDIDFVPSKDLNRQFQYFLQRQLRSAKTTILNSKTAFVLPSFEMKSKQVESMKKDDLSKRIQNGTIRPFYLEVCKTCQADTDYERWFQFPAIDFLEIAYTVDWQRPWEPFYIAHKDNLPLYDSRFKQYGFNRISQLCEMHMTGYKFLVFNTGFLVHRGFKDSNGFHPKKAEEHQFNKQLFEKFKDELKERYPESKQHC